MAVNRDKPDRWKADIIRSVDMFNEWFMQFAPETFRQTRSRTSHEVENTLRATDNLKNVRSEVLRQNPNVLAMLRMCTCPPLARDRLVGLAKVPKSMVARMEKQGALPVHLHDEALDKELKKIGTIVEKMADRDIFTWLDVSRDPTGEELRRAATIVADRLCGAVSDPIIRNAQERRQLATIRTWLEGRGYSCLETGSGVQFGDMEPGTCVFHLNVPVRQERSAQVREVNMPIDAVIMRSQARQGELPLLIEAKSAGDYTNTNKRRKEEATKVSQLRSTYGENVRFLLFLCGYFDTGYLGYKAAEAIDWVWEHRIDDLAEFGV